VQPSIQCPCALSTLSGSCILSGGGGALVLHGNLGSFTDVRGAVLVAATRVDMGTHLVVAAAIACVLQVSTDFTAGWTHSSRRRSMPNRRIPCWPRSRAPQCTWRRSRCFGFCGMSCTVKLRTRRSPGGSAMLLVAALASHRCSVLQRWSASASTRVVCAPAVCHETLHHHAQVCSVVHPDKPAGTLLICDCQVACMGSDGFRSRPYPQLERMLPSNLHWLWSVDVIAAIARTATRAQQPSGARARLRPEQSKRGALSRSVVL
jgi:hypothetical protein